MVTGLTIGRKKYAAVEPEMILLAAEADSLTTQLSSLVERDADAYSLVSSAYQIPKNSPDRDAAITTALIGAAEVPLETARACVRVAQLALAVATKGNSNAVSDAGVAALLAEAGCKGAAYNVRINVAALPDKTQGQDLEREALDLVAKASAIAAEACAIVERDITS
jgi:glutamate formiminotransferase/formiminotetrahydrofolate cyclodeaminase